MSRPRLVDVAARAGVSTATASLVLRDRPGPSAASRDAVHAAAAALGYRPDRTASVLARRRSHLLGVLLEISNPFHAELVGALDAAAERFGLDLVLSSVTSRRSEAEAVETLLDFRCEALVLLGAGLGRAALDDLAATCPTVLVGRAGTGSVPGVRADDGQGLELAVAHLAGLGHRRIAFVDGPSGSIATARRRGYREAMTRRGVREAVDVVPGGQTEQAGSQAAARLLARPDAVRPSAVICFNDRCAIGLRDELLRAGVPVPQRISVIGYDDSPPARLATVDLTTVSQDPPGLAEATMALLARRLDAADTASSSAGADVGASGPGGDVVISPRLVVRGSTAAPA